MSTVLATHATVIVPGVPPNWSQWRGSSLARDAAKGPWRDLARMLAHSGRNAARWPMPVRTDPPARRWLEVEIHKMRPLYDHDGAVSALKPLIDGAFRGRPGPLAWDDGPDWLALITPPSEMQRVAASAAGEHVLLRVHLVDPR